MRAEGVPGHLRLIAVLAAAVALIAGTVVAAPSAHADPATIKYCVYQDASAAPGDCSGVFASLLDALNQAQSEEASGGTWAEVAIGPGTWVILSTAQFGFVAAAGAHTDIHGAGVGVTTIETHFDPGNTDPWSAMVVQGDTSADTSIHDLSFEVHSTGSLNHVTGLDVSHASVHDVRSRLIAHDDADEVSSDPHPTGGIGIWAHDDVKISDSHISVVSTIHKNDADEYVGAWGLGTGVRTDGTGVTLTDVTLDFDNQSGGPQLIRDPFVDQPSPTGVQMDDGTLSITRAKILGLPFGIDQRKGDLSMVDSLIEVPSEDNLHTIGIISSPRADDDFMTLTLDGDTIVRTFPLTTSTGSSHGLHLINTAATIKNTLIEVGQPGSPAPGGQSILCAAGSSLHMSYSIYTSIRVYDPAIGCAPADFVLSHNRTDYTQPFVDWPNHDWTPKGWSWLANGGDPATVAGARTDLLDRARIVRGTIDVGAFECQAGCVSLAQPPAVPGKPSSAKATKVNGGLKISWGATGDGGADLTSFVVKVGSKSKTVSATSHSATITGLTLGKSATWSVRAVNAVGNGTAATGSAVIIGLPHAPTSLSLTQKSGGKLVVKWKAPSTSKAHPRTGFKVYVSGVLKKTTTGTSVTLTGLVKGHTYTIKVVAYNSAGKSSSLSKSYHRTIT